MVRYVTPAEFQRWVRDAARKQQDAINNYNRQVDQHNRNVMRQRQELVRAVEQHNRTVENHNREVHRRHNQAIEDYNRVVRAHNSNVQANQARQRLAFSRLPRDVVGVRYSVLRASTLTLNQSYSRLEGQVGNQTSDDNDELVFGIPSSENANSLELMAALLGNPAESDINPGAIQHSAIERELRQVSNDLDSRWKGAVFALNPGNPDAARHFCTSAREIVTSILELRAPDTDVLQHIPNCAVTRMGKPTRREKIRYLLGRRGIALTELGDFIENDVSNVVDLFQVFNGATHGEAGCYEWTRLASIKKRVEGGILFLSRICQRT
jgi:hypothetical protein